MALGLPTISTNYSGNLEFQTPDNSFLVEHEGIVPVSSMIDNKEDFRWACDLGFIDMEWAKPSITNTAKAMRYVYDNQGKAAKVGEQASKDVLAKFSKPIVGRLMADRLKEIETEQKRYRRRVSRPCCRRVGEISILYLPGMDVNFINGEIAHSKFWSNVVKTPSINYGFSNGVMDPASMAEAVLLGEHEGLVGGADVEHSWLRQYSDDIDGMEWSRALRNISVPKWYDTFAAIKRKICGNVVKVYSSTILLSLATVHKRRGDNYLQDYIELGNMLLEIILEPWSRHWVVFSPCQPRFDKAGKFCGLSDTHHIYGYGSIPEALPKCDSIGLAAAGLAAKLGQLGVRNGK
jgi:hypothetical protein